MGSRRKGTRGLGEWKDREEMDNSRKEGTEKEIREKLETWKRGREKENGKWMGGRERSKG